jgi:hypothetical protein
LLARIRGAQVGGVSHHRTQQAGDVADGQKHPAAAKDRRCGSDREVRGDAGTGEHADEHSCGAEEHFRAGSA